MRLLATMEGRQALAAQQKPSIGQASGREGAEGTGEVKEAEGQEPGTSLRAGARATRFWVLVDFPG